MVKFGNQSSQFKQGAQSYADGMRAKNNPYPVKSASWEDWKDGWAFCKAVDICFHYLREADKGIEDPIIKAIDIG